MKWLIMTGADVREKFRRILLSAGEDVSASHDERGEADYDVVLCDRYASKGHHVAAGVMRCNGWPVVYCVHGDNRNRWTGFGFHVVNDPADFAAWLATGPVLATDRPARAQ